MSASTSTPVVALMSPGDMGHSVGALLGRNGVRVITALEGRSQRTVDLAGTAGIEGVADDISMIEAADLLLSIVAPSEAEVLAERLAPAIERKGQHLIYVDCNAVAPTTARRIAGMITKAGAGFVDAGIIGPPPRQDSASTRIYASGRDADHLAGLNAFGLDVRVMGENIGDASALKMCYAALNKGTTALMTGVSVVAARFGITETFTEELALSQGMMLERMRRQVPSMVPKAHRWIGEMEEIASTFDAADLSPAVFEGIADIYRLAAESPMAAASPEAWNRAGKSYDDVVAELSTNEKRHGH